MTYTSKIEKLADSEISIEVEVSWDELQKGYTKALADIQKNATIDGFRKGNAPEKILVEKYGELYIIGEGAEIIIDEVYPKLLEEHKLNTIGHPEISIIKLAKDNPLVFKAKVALMPKAEMPDYKEIAKKIAATLKEVSVEEKEITDTLEEIRKNKAHEELHKSGAAHTEGDEKSLVLEELNDDFAKKLGNFKDLEELKTKIKENMLEEKKIKEKQRVRLEIVENVIEKTKLEVPKVLVESELDKLVNQFKNDISQFGMKPEDYLAQIKKTEEDLRKEWTPEAEKRAKMNVVLAEISIAEKIVPNPEEVEAQAAQLLATYSDLDPLRAKIYVEHMMINEEVFKFLEGQK